MIRWAFLIFFLVFDSFVSVGYGQASSAVGSGWNETKVSLSAFIEPKRVPLNRSVVFTVQVAWEGDLDLIEIGDIEEPLLSNFDVVGTASANRVIGASGGQRAIKEIAYTLRPRTLGMAYVEPAGLSYEDKRTGKSHALMTQRIGVEVVSPVPEPGEGVGWWVWVAVGVGVVGGGVALVSWMRRRSVGPEEETEVVRVVEEAYLDALKQTVDLKTQDRREAFASLTKLFRGYLAEKYRIPALEATTEELLRTLAEAELDEGLIRRGEVLFSKADVVKFSGQDATQAELEEAYTTVETILESDLARAIERMREVEEASKKKNKWFGKA